MNQVKFTTDDGVVIYANFVESQEKNGKAVILLHMLRTDKSYWTVFSDELNKNNYTTIAIDLRGHGKSVVKNGKEYRWQDFTEDDFNKMVLDVKAAKLFLIERGYEPKNIAIIGASIGANTAINYAATDEEIRSIALLSPGLDYRGVKTEKSMSIFDGNVFIASSKEDEPSYSSCLKLKDLGNSRKTVVFYENAGHGTWMFQKTDLAKKLLEWLNSL
ncbi:MAG: alpha/beta fold hydrolase [Candidatus Aenigmarchaeota archaeon]|nr:alpha/beta fold hydrolase [Candidatus Aenigmarchaeota archaeon]